MRIPSDSGSLCKALGAGAALISLAACSGGGSQFSPGAGQGASAQSHAFARVAPGPLSFADLLPRATGDRSKLLIVEPDAIKAQIDASQYGATSDPGEVNEYVAANKKNKKPFCQLGNLTGINAIETDASGNLWVPYQTADGVNQTVEYAPDCGKIGTTLADPDGQPVDIAFAASGIDYVSDILTNGSAGPGEISVYPKGKTSPTGHLTNPAVFFSLGVAVDTKGNVYQSYLGNSSGTAGGVLEFKAGKGKGAVLKGIKIDEPGVVFLDSKDNLIVPDQGGSALDTYAPPYTKLTSTFALQAQSIQCSLDKAETTVACADVPNDAIDVYTYPAGKYEFSFNNGLSTSLETIGVAQDPKY